jgi:O-acetyl-ADP-ribose deacetylase (regulator of RNase III)
VAAVVEFLRSHSAPEHVRFVVFSQQDEELYRALLEELNQAPV